MATMLSSPISGRSRNKRSEHASNDFVADRKLELLKGHPIERSSLVFLLWLVRFLRDPLFKRPDRSLESFPNLSRSVSRLPFISSSSLIVSQSEHSSSSPIFS